MRNPDVRMREGLRVFFSGGAHELDPTTLVRVMNAARDALEEKDVPTPLLEGRLPEDGYVWRAVEGVEREFSLEEVLEVVAPLDYADPAEEVPTPYEMLEDWKGIEEALWDPRGRHGPWGGFHVSDVRDDSRRFDVWAQVPEGTGRLVPTEPR